MKHEETYGEMGETYRELPLGGFLSNLVTSFQAASYIAGLTPNDYRVCLIIKSIHSSPFFRGFPPHMVSYAKSTLEAVGSECR